jgi:dimethylamine---corrinoid protein Co-methyltransferase
VGTGDPAGVAIPHAMTSGMGGIRTAGDLVARMQMTRGMKIAEAKDYVAGKLGLSVQELIDVVRMREVREDLKIGFITSRGGHPKGIEAKHHIARLLDIDINSVNVFKARCE